jgi:hypothetical protein
LAGGRRRNNERELHQSGVRKKKISPITFGAFAFISQEKTRLTHEGNKRESTRSSRVQGRAFAHAMGPTVLRSQTWT